MVQALFLVWGINFHTIEMNGNAPKKLTSPDIRRVSPLFKKRGEDFALITTIPPLYL